MKGTGYLDVDFIPNYEENKRSTVPVSSHQNSKVVFKEFVPNEQPHSSFKVTNPFYQTSMFDYKINKLDQIGTGTGHLSRFDNDTNSLEIHEIENSICDNTETLGVALNSAMEFK